MALSYLTESEAPRDFRVSSTESEGHYKKCLLCYTVKKNFYCAECVRNGNFVHSSMPYSDKFSEKQAKLLRLKLNRQHVLDRCEKLLTPKVKNDILLTESKLSRDKLDLLRLALEQRRITVCEKRKELSELTQYNTELSLKLPRYQKRVASLGKHAQNQRVELQNKFSQYNDQAQALAALRRSRIRQLTKYIFPVYMSYDASDSIEDLEFLGEDLEERPRRPQLHIVAPWIHADGDFSHVQSWVAENKEAALSAEPASNPAHCASAALGLAAQLVALLAWTLDVRTPYAITLSEYVSWRGCAGPARRLRACAAALCARAALRRAACGGGALGGLHALALAAAADDPTLGRVEPCISRSWSCEEEWADAWEGPDDEPEPPEHLHWPDDQLEELSATPPPMPPPSLVTSAAASIASMWRGWTK